MNNEEFWCSFLKSLESKMNTVSFNCWFKAAKFVDIVDNTLLFSVENDYYKKYLYDY